MTEQKWPLWLFSTPLLRRFTLLGLCLYLPLPFRLMTPLPFPLFLPLPLLMNTPLPFATFTCLFTFRPAQSKWARNPSPIGVSVRMLLFNTSFSSLMDVSSSLMNKFINLFHRERHEHWRCLNPNLSSALDVPLVIGEISVKNLWTCFWNAAVKSYSSHSRLNECTLTQLNSECTGRLEKEVEEVVAVDVQGVNLSRWMDL